MNLGAIALAEAEKAEDNDSDLDSNFHGACCVAHTSATTMMAAPDLLLLSLRLVPC